MAERVSIMLDTDLFKKLRLIQAKLLVDTEKSVSFSRVINERLRKGLEK